MFSTKSYDQSYFEKLNTGSEISFSFYEAALNKDTASLTTGYTGVCVFVNDQLDQDTIAAIADNGVKLIALRCAGFNNVDLAAAKENGIKIVRVPAYSPESIAEHAVALMLTLNRKTHKAYNRIREGNFSLNGLIGFNLHQKTIGVIGTGVIGATLCRIMKAFGCKILAYDIYPSKKLIEMGVQYVALETLFQQSDIISLHCPLTPETKHLINRESLSQNERGSNDHKY